MRRLAVVATLATLLVAMPARASTINVDTTADAVAADGQCSLREAITAANTDAVANPGAGECAAGQGADTVELGAGTFTIVLPANDDTNGGGDFDVLGNALTIQGAGASQTIVDGNQVDRVFDIRPGRIATISGITVTGGRARDGGNGGDVGQVAGQTSAGGDAFSGQPGGGIANNGGSLTITDSTITGNVAGNGGHGGSGHGADGDLGSTGGNARAGTGGDGGGGGSGGAIFTTGVLFLTRVTVSNNNAGNGGAGGAATGGQGGGGTSGSGGTGGLAQSGSGGGGGNGGGIAEQGGGSVTIDQSSIEGNRSGNGGPSGLSQGGDGGLAGGASGQGGVGGNGLAGLGGSGGFGGGISATDALTVTRSLLSGNAAGDGNTQGAVSGGDGGVGFSAGRNGGAGGSASLSISGTGGYGGAIGATSATLTNVTVTGNSAGTAGNGGTATGGNGGASTSGTAGAGGNASGGSSSLGGSGGAAWISNLSSWNHGTITSNTSGAGGSAPTVVAGTGSSTGSTTPGGAGNPGHYPVVMDQMSPGGATFANSIIGATPSAGCLYTTDGGNNISQAGASCPGANVDPLLGALADNGGPTETQALGAGSPAIDLVPAVGAGCSGTDQRLVVRPAMTACDAGAYEFAPPVASTGDASGTTVSGATLNALVTANARATSFHFEFGTTTAYGTSTADQSAGSGVDAAPVSTAIESLAPGTTYHYRVVATNAEGQAIGEDKTFTTLTPPATPGGGSGTDKTAPVFTSASISPKKVKRKKGATIKFGLSEAARVVVTVERKLPGRRVGGKCRAQTKKNRKKRACTRYVRVGSFAIAAKADANVKKWNGRLRKKPLTLGSYRLTLVATDAAGNKSQPRRLAFKVVRR